MRPGRGWAVARAAIAVWLGGAGILLAGERWSITSMGGVPVGYLHESVKPAPSDPTLLETERESTMVFNRLGNRLTMTSRHVYRENASGVLVSGAFTEVMASQPTTTSIEVTGDRLTLHTQTGDRQYQREVALEGTLLGPEGVRRLSFARLERPGDEMTCVTFVGELAAAKRLTRTCTERSAETLVVRESIESLPARTVWLDVRGDVRRTLDRGPFGDVVVELADRERALAATGGRGGELPAEVFERTLVRSNVRLPSARAMDSLTLRLSPLSAGGEWPALRSHDQQVLAQSGTAVDVRIERVAPPEDDVALGEVESDEMRECLEPNATINSDDDAIRDVAHEVVGERQGAWAAALALCDWVTGHMTFDLGVALAPATEVVRRRRGTCAAYASLLTALCRAAGIPARYVLGLVYVNGTWGGHAWTEVGIGERWIPIDAALPSDGPADAARVRVGASTLHEGPGGLVAEAQKLYGQMAIEVVSYRVGGRAVDVEAGHASSRVDGNRYRNVDLGLVLEKPADFAFTSLDAAWPQDAMLALAGPHGEKIQLVQAAALASKPLEPQLWSALQARVSDGERRELKVRERRVLALVGPVRSAFAVVSGADLWLLVAEGAALEPWLGALSIGVGEETR